MSTKTTASKTTASKTTASKTTSNKKAASPKKASTEVAAKTTELQKAKAEKGAEALRKMKRASPTEVEGKKVKLLVKENPKRGKSEKRFAIYRDGMTVEEYVAKGGLRADIRYDLKHKFIALQ